MRGMDYKRARAVLRQRRFEIHWNVTKLEAASGVNRTTIYHLEKIENEPDHEPDFKTMERLAVAMGLTLTQFFAQIEGVASESFPAEALTGTTNAPSLNRNLQGEQAIGDPVPAAASGGGERFGDDVVLAAIGETIADAVDRGFTRIEAFLKSREQAGTPGAHAPERHETRRKTRGRSA